MSGQINRVNFQATSTAHNVLLSHSYFPIPPQPPSLIISLSISHSHRATCQPLLTPKMRLGKTPSQTQMADYSSCCHRQTDTAGSIFCGALNSSRFGIATWSFLKIDMRHATYKVVIMHITITSTSDMGPFFKMT